MAVRRRPRSEVAPGASVPTAVPPPWDPLTVLRSCGHHAAASRLEQEWQAGRLGDVDLVRIVAAVRGAQKHPERLSSLAAQIEASGPAAVPHRSGQRDLAQRRSQHSLHSGQVRIGLVTDDLRNATGHRGAAFALDMNVLRTSLLVVGPPGSGKTHSFARPLLEHLSLQALAGQASVVAIDPKGDDFAIDGMFDIEIDLTRPDATWGFDLYGGAADPQEAADRLASALMPVGVSADKTYFMDASRNALYNVLAPFHAANGAYPSIHQLLAILDGDERAVQSVADKLRHKGIKDAYRRMLTARAGQRGLRHDPAASLVERLALLDRPALVHLFDRASPRFSMNDLNQPVRVRIVLPEARFPDASVILARVAISQFVQVTTAPDTNRGIFKGLIVDEAGRYIDDYVTRGVQRARSNNAGLILLTQSLGDFPEELRTTMFGSVGCKAVFAGIDPTDARYYADFWGTRWTNEETYSRNRGNNFSMTPGTGWLGMEPDRETFGTSESSGVSVKQVERDLWSPSEIINRIPPGHALISLARSDGERTPPILVNLRD